MLEKIIYVAGYGRSGSTLLDMMLGSDPRIFGAGEMSTICRHVWPNDEFCACHARVRACPLWSGIMAEWLASSVDPAAHAKLQQKIEPVFAPARSLGGATARRYGEETLALLRITAAHAGRPVLLDSSKSPGRGLALAAAAQAAGVDFRVLHLVRDPRAVAYSMSKPMKIDTEAGVQKRIRAHPAWRTALRWNYVNAGADALMRRLPDGHGLRLRYEDLVSQPEAVLNNVGIAVGQQLGTIAEAIAEGAQIAASHQVAGSRIRMSGPMALRPDLNWQDRMAPAARAQVERISGGRMRRYGYD
ncbi:sulfotransferase family protein [Paracoccus xiamenensis]|uniref:sulfotransferase family protein n=1 Tax=Paracoccus xiamenensis TaxID=2714901 RepID=UPI00140ADE47|nr:sulfotransferase [Paracoccus xiamenensis]NHF73101.1 sulfotransferase [Paracoccus xiamenensis]